MTLYLPPHIAEQKRREFEADVLRNVTIEDARAREFTVLLQRVNRDLFMVKAHDVVDADVPLRPGFYHVLKRNEGAPMSVLVVHENDRYCEPDSRVFDRLAAGNMAERRVTDELERQEKAVEQAVAKERRNRNEARRAELKGRVNAAVRAQVSMDRTVPWTQNASGRRPR